MSLSTETRFFANDVLIGSDAVLAVDVMIGSVNTQENIYIYIGDSVFVADFVIGSDVVLNFY